MKERSDALLAASEISLKLEYLAKLEAVRGSVATVGILDVNNGSMNVVPNDVNLKAEIRSISLESRNNIINKLNAFMQEIIRKRGIRIKCEWSQEERPISMNKLVIDEVNKICSVLNIPSMKMISGAGHDSMNMAKHWPTGLIFIPSVNSISHHPDEYTTDEDIKNGITVLKEIVLSVD